MTVEGSAKVDLLEALVKNACSITDVWNLLKATTNHRVLMEAKTFIRQRIPPNWETDAAIEGLSENSDDAGCEQGRNCKRST